MRGVVMHSAGDVRVEEREDPKIIEPTDAIVRLTATCICGSDLWPYRGIEPADHQVMGHEYVGIVEEVGDEVENIEVGDFVVGSFVIRCYWARRSADGARAGPSAAADPPGRRTSAGRAAAARGSPSLDRRDTFA